MAATPSVGAGPGPGGAGEFPSAAASASSRAAPAAATTAARCRIFTPRFGSRFFLGTNGIQRRTAFRHELGRRPAGSPATAAL